MPFLFCARNLEIKMINLIERLYKTDRCYCGSKVIGDELKLVACLFHESYAALKQAQAEIERLRFEWYSPAYIDDKQNRIINPQRKRIKQLEVENKKLRALRKES